MSGICRECLRAVQKSASSYSTSLSASSIKQRAWASALFVGDRLTIAITADDDDTLDQWLIALPDMELPLTGHFVASAEVIERRSNAATIELLVVEA